jgi:nitrogen fixation/metabolism regulation signal transduction histidine kinase
MNIALWVVAALGAMLVFLLASASADTALFSRHTPLLIGMNALAALVLLGLVVAQVRQLFREYRMGVFGARLKSRLLLMLALMAVVPGVLVYAVSMQFAVKSIDSWFDVRVEAALEGGLDLGRGVLDAMQNDLLTKGRTMAYDIADASVVGPVELNRLREQAGVPAAALLTATGQLIANSSDSLRGLLPELPSAAQLRQARLGSGIARVDGDAASGYVVRVLVPVGTQRIDGGLGAELRVLQLEQPVPPAITHSASAVEAAHRDYQELQLGHEGLKRLYTLTLTFTLLLALFAAVALAFFLAARLAKPLLMLAEGTRAVAAGDLTPREVLETDDELGVLTRSFSSMTLQLDQARKDSEAAQASMIVAQRAAAWGEVARRLAHEIKNPLTPIQLSAERLQMKLAGKLEPADAAMLERATRTIVDQVEAMKNMVNDFRDYARLPPPMLAPLDLNALIAEVLELYEDGPVAVTANLDPALPMVLADADQMRQVLHNLVKNASEAMAEQQKVGAGPSQADAPPVGGSEPGLRARGANKVGAGGTANVKVTTQGNGRTATLTVSDNGTGFPAQILEHAFEPYVTTKPKGTGLGLAIVHKIIDDHGGTITLANRPAEEGGGAEVSLQLPLHHISRPNATAA